jgi:threonine aldolase
MTIDLRSDTVTHPTPAMRQAMAAAEVGDDGLGEDPTVIRLEEKAARLLGKDAALFVPSGTMGNLVALLTHTQRGDEVIVGDRSHIFLNEVGGASALGGLLLRQVPNRDNGTLDLDAVEAAVRRPGIAFPVSRLLCLENTHNFCSGAVLDAQYTAAAADLARRKGLSVHMDGARIFNAAVALGVPVSTLAAPVDSITFCLSKGLSCPVGSLLCGEKEFIARARRIRRMVGGGMRQAGIIAAAGLVALDTMVDRLAEDHANARALAKSLASVPGLRLDPVRVETNIVIFQTVGRSAPEVMEALAAKGLRASYVGGASLRMVTHYGITAEDVEEAVRITGEVMQP